MPKNADFFHCEKCAFKCSKLSNWNKHVATRKHKIQPNTTKIQHEKMPNHHECECGKVYNHRASLFNHKKKCIFIKNEQKNEKNDDFFEKSEKKIQKNEKNEIFEQKNEKSEKKMKKNEKKVKKIDEKSEKSEKREKSEKKIQKNEKKNEKSETEELTYKEMFYKLMEKKEEQDNAVQKMLTEIIPKIGNTTTNTTNINTVNNRQYNINLFLNEHCSNAMTLNDFIGTLKIESNDVENIGKKGFIEGISQLIIDGLENIDIRDRPIHCADMDQSLMYVHDDHMWVEDSDQSLMNNAINKAGKKNLQAISEMEPINEDDATKYWDILGESTVSESDKDKKYSGIIKKVAQHTQLTQDCIDNYKK